MGYVSDFNAMSTGDYITQTLSNRRYAVLWSFVLARMQVMKTRSGASCAFCPKHHHEGGLIGSGSLRSGQYTDSAFPISETADIPLSTQRNY